MRSAIIFLNQVQTVHEERTITVDDVGQESLSISSKADSACKASFLARTLTGHRDVSGTEQHESLKYSFIRFGQKLWVKSKATKKKWKLSTSSALKPFGIQLDTPLTCGNANVPADVGVVGQLPGYANLGQDSVDGVAVWHIRMSQDLPDGSGGSYHQVTDVFATQDHSVPLEISISNTEAGQFSTASTQWLSDFGKKLSIKAPHN